MVEQARDRVTLRPLQSVRLSDLVHSARCQTIVDREQYYRCCQHDHKPYTWDGSLARFGDASDIPAVGYVPMRMRRPTAQMHLGKVIVRRLSSMVFGHGRFPQIMVAGDDEAQDYARALAIEAHLPTRMSEARNKGGSAGTVAMSWAFVDGLPRVEVHSAAHMTVLEWADYERRIPRAALKAYSFERSRFDKDGKRVSETYYYARLWTDTFEAVWPEIPEKVARSLMWSSLPASVVNHPAPRCPVYWIQNQPDSESLDGVGDYEGLEGDLDEIDMQLSAAAGGTKANVDPTLVIHDSPKSNKGVIQKGTGHVLYSEKGASYLELSGSSVQTARELVRDMRQFVLDVTGVVLTDPEKMAGSGISAAAMRTRYAPMLAECDVLRDQYGTALKQILADMLVTAQRLSKGPRSLEEGSALRLPPRVEYEPDGQDITDREKIAKLVERTPGSSAHVSLVWGPYFEPGWEDIGKATAAAQIATGGKQVISQRTAVARIGPLFGVTDVARELGEIDEDSERGVAIAQRAFAESPMAFDVPADEEPADDDEADDPDDG